MLNYFKAGYLFFIIYMSNILNNPDKVSDKYFTYLKKAIEMNGALCIKIAQWLSNQKSLSPILESRFQSLHENCPEHPIEYTTKIIKNEYKQKFKYFYVKPLASGSIGQVHRAIMMDNREVVVKVKHPNLEPQINLWFKIIDYAMNKKAFEMFNIDELKTHILEQMSYEKEFNNLKTFRNNFKNINIIKIPEPIFYSDNLLIMEYIKSQKYCDIDISTDKKKEISKILFYTLTKMCVIDNFVHGDLHFGNWGLNFDNNNNFKELVIYDAGIVSYTDDKDEIKNGFCICIKRNPNEILDYFFSYFDKNNIKYPPDMYNNIKNKWKEHFEWPISVNMIPHEMMKNKVVIPTLMSTIILSCSLISKNLSLILDTTFDHNLLFMDLYANSKRTGFYQISNHFKDFYLNDKTIKAFGYIEKMSEKYNIDFEDISDISSDEDISDISSDKDISDISSNEDPI